MTIEQFFLALRSNYLERAEEKLRGIDLGEVETANLNGFIEGIETLVKELHKVDKKVEIDTWNMLLSAHAKAERLDEAEGVRHRMRLHGTEPDVATWIALLRGYVEAGQFDIADHVMNRMRDSGRLEWKVPRRLREEFLDLRDAVLANYVESGYLHEAEETLVRLFPPEFLTGTHTARALKSIIRLKDELEERNVRPKASTWAALLLAYAKQGRFDEAECTLSEMKVLGEAEVAAWNTLLTAYANAGHFDDAEYIIHRMRFHAVKPNVETWNSLLRSYARSEQFDAAEDTLKKMKGDCTPNGATWNTLLAGYANAGRFDDAEDTLKRMKGDCKPNGATWTTLLQAYANAGRLDDAENTLERMELQGLRLDRHSWGELFIAYRKAGECSRAKKAVERFQQEYPDSHLGFFYKEVAQTYSKARERPPKFLLDHDNKETLKTRFADDIAYFLANAIYQHGIDSGDPNLDQALGLLRRVDTRHRSKRSFDLACKLAIQVEGSANRTLQNLTNANEQNIEFLQDAFIRLLATDHYFRGQEFSDDQKNETIRWFREEMSDHRNELLNLLENDEGFSGESAALYSDSRLYVAFAPSFNPEEDLPQVREFSNLSDAELEQVIEWVSYSKQVDCLDSSLRD